MPAWAAESDRLAMRATAADCLKPLLDAAEPGQPARMFAFNQGLEGLSQHVRLFLQPGEFLGLRQQLVVDRHGCTHAQNPTASEWNTYYTSMTADKQTEIQAVGAAESPSVISTISGGTPSRNGRMLQPRPPDTTISQASRRQP